jgi:hypothetical protein
MLICRRICFVALVLAMLGAMSQAANAAPPHGSHGGHMGHGRNVTPFVVGGVGDYGGFWGGDSYYWYLYQLTRDGTIGAPPYFSLYPPVYYSYPVPRTYGYSPFAYPNYVITPDPLGGSAKPETMINPYVPQPKTETKVDPTSAQTSAAPQMILNPFVGPTAVARTDK